MKKQEPIANMPFGCPPELLPLVIDSMVLALAQYPVRFQANLSAAVIENAPTLQAALRQMVELGDIEDRVQQQMQAG